MIHLDPVTSYDAVAALICTQGFAVLDVEDRVPWAFAHPIFEGLRRISALSRNDQRDWSIDRSTCNPKDPDDGVLIRGSDIENPGALDPDKPSDEKIVFMYRPETRVWLAQRDLGTEPEWDSFWSAQQNLWDIAWEIALNTARALDIRTCGEYQVRDNLLRLKRRSKLRAQRYVGPRSDDPNMIAQMHRDRSCLTVHLCEDHPGLLILANGTLIQVPASPGRVIIFAGSQLQQMTGGTLVHEHVAGKIRTRVEGGLIQALEHGAACVNTAAQPWPGHRHMCVFFAKGIWANDELPDP